MQNTHRDDPELIQGQISIEFVVNKMVPVQVFLLVLLFSM